MSILFISFMEGMNHDIILQGLRRSFKRDFEAWNATRKNKGMTPYEKREKQFRKMVFQLFKKYNIGTKEEMAKLKNLIERM